MSKAYLIDDENNELIAVVETEAEDYEQVEYELNDEIRAGMISREKKWGDYVNCKRFGIEININLFLVQ